MKGSNSDFLNKRWSAMNESYHIGAFSEFNEVNVQSLFANHAFLAYRHT